LIKIIQNIYTNTRLQVKPKEGLSEPIPMEKGIRQGDSLRPLSFNVIMDELIKSTNNQKTL
jgi:hypothetical protein